MNQDFELKELGQIKYLKCRELDNTNLAVNAFTTRSGGVSRSPFDSLNVSYPHSCLAAIFPSIGSCCYKIKNQDEVNNCSSKNKLSSNSKVIYKQNKDEWCLDLKEANYLQLIKGGVEEKNIFVNEICTADHPELFFSYRRDKGNTGRMAAIFMLN